MTHSICWPSVFYRCLTFLIYKAGSGECTFKSSLFFSFTLFHHNFDFVQFINEAHFCGDISLSLDIMQSMTFRSTISGMDIYVINLSFGIIILSLCQKLKTRNSSGSNSNNNNIQIVNGNCRESDWRIYIISINNHK